jgi:DNA topoisomerase IA
MLVASIASPMAHEGEAWVDPAISEGAGCARHALLVGPKMAKARIAPVFSLQAVRVPEYARLYAAAVARRQADQIYNLSLTRTATVILGQGARRVIGVGRVKTPTLAIVCKRELEIRNFVPLAYFEIVVTAKVAGGQFQMRHAPQDRIVKREIAQQVVKAAEGFEGALTVRVEDKRQVPPKLLRHFERFAG